MEKQAKLTSKNVLFFGVLVLVLFGALVLADRSTVVWIPKSQGNYFNTSEGTSQVFNVSLNFSDSEGDYTNNITEINITLPLNFTFTPGTNDTDGTGTFTFTNFSVAQSHLLNASSVLSWSNWTGYLFQNTSARLNYSVMFTANATTAGWYTLPVSITNRTNATSGYTEWYNLTVFVNDTDAPVIDVAGASFNNWTNYSGNLVLNISATEDTPQIVIFSLINATNTGTQTNYTATNIGGWWNATIDTSTLSDGLYNITVWMNDSSRVKNNTVVFKNILFDNTAPAITLTRSSSSTKTSLVVSIAVTDGTGNMSNVSGKCTQNYGAHGSVSGSGAGTQTFTGTEMACGTSYTIAILCTDYAGNTGTNSITTATDACSTGGADPSGGSGGATWSNTYAEDTQELSDVGTVQKSLGATERVRVKIGGAKHIIGVTAVTSTTATIHVASDAQESVFNIGETKKFDVTDDGYYDLKITLNDILNNKADITILSIYEEMPADVGDGSGTGAGEEGGAEGGSLMWLWIVLLVVVVVVVIYFVRKHLMK